MGKVGNISRTEALRLIEQVPRREIIVDSWGDTEDIMDAIMAVIDKDHLTSQVSDLAERFRGTDAEDQYQKLFELWHFCRHEIRYRLDPRGEQHIKHPGRVLQDGYCDCKGLSILPYFVCRHLGLPTEIRFASYERDREIGHVYTKIHSHGRTVLFDAVLPRFDDEEPATYTTDRKPKIFNELMTRIIEIAGTKRTAAPNVVTRHFDLPLNEMPTSERKQRAGLVSDRSFVDTSNLSTAEMLVHLRTQRALMSAQFYEGTPKGKRAMEEYLFGTDVLHGGLHNGFKGFNGLFRTQEAGVYSAVRSARNGTRPASGFFTWEEKQRNPARGIGDPFIPVRDCGELFPIFPVPPGQDENAWVDFQGGRQKACMDENNWREMLNRDFERSAHHPLFSFMTNGQLSKMEPVRTFKQADHVRAIDELHVHSRIGRTLLKEWQQNGIIRHNIETGAGPLDGRTSIEGLIEGKLNDDRAGVDGLPIAAIAAIITAIAGALSAASSLVASMKQRQPSAAGLFQQRVPLWGQGPFSPGKQDFITTVFDEDGNGQISTGESINALLPIGLALGGVALLLGGNNNQQP